MMTKNSKTTTDHDEIKTWVEGRGGKPGKITGDETESKLVIIFSGTKDPAVEETSWERFFEIFDQNNLLFLCEEGKNGKQTYFCEIISMDIPEGEKSEEDEGAVI